MLHHISFDLMVRLIDSMIRLIEFQITRNNVQCHLINFNGYVIDVVTKIERIMIWSTIIIIF
jgi:hypothetical protein